MSDEEVIEISSGEGEPYIDRRTILEPVIRRVVDALGGLEGGVYILGDEVSGCLRDLKKLWRKDDTDDERTVARIYWDTRVLPNDLIPILLATSGAGHVEDKRGIACADLMSAMTWPIDMAEELKELDEELDKGTDYTQLALSHLNYKAALTKPDIMRALFGIVLPPLTVAPRARTPRDVQIINVVLYLVRNLAFIKDLPANMNLSADQAEYASLQSKLIRVLSETHMMNLLLTIATNSDYDPMFTVLNTLVLEIFYLLFRGVKPAALTMDQAKEPADNLHRLLAGEEKTRQDAARKASSRHSRFGTTIAVTLNNKSQTAVLHRQQAISQEAGSIMDISKKHKTKRGNKMDELARQDNLSIEAKEILQNLARDFVESCFNPFLAALLKDIKSERAKITEKDQLRLLYVTQWFLEFFLCSRAKEGGDRWGFGLIAEVTERGWIVWVLKRMREAVDEKPKAWTELQAGIECLTQLLLLIETMSATNIDDQDLTDAAELLQQQLIYNGEVLDIAYESLRSYKTGTQSLAYLDASVYLGYALLRMLERWSKVKNGDAYVRRKKVRTKKTNGEEEGVPEEEDIPVEKKDEPDETMFTFDAFEMKFANSDITHTLLIYLARYRDFDSSENMRRVVGLMHRQAVRVKAEALFFQVSTLNLFKQILADQKSFPKETPYKDLVTLVNFILRKFFKKLEEEPWLAIEAFYPTNTNRWKKYSTWKPDEKKVKALRAAEDSKFPPEVQIKKGYSWSQQMGIAIATLVEDGQLSLIEWVKEILTYIHGQRVRTIEAIDAKPEGALLDSEDEEDGIKLHDEPSHEAISKLVDYMIPYPTDEKAEAATKNAKLKLMFRLVKFFVLDENAEEFEWYVPAGILPADMASSLKVIDQFLEEPFDLGGKKAASLLSKKRAKKRRVQRSVSPGASASGSDEDLDLADFKAGNDDEEEGGERGDDGGKSRRRGRGGKKRRQKVVGSDEDDDDKDEAPRRSKKREKKKKEKEQYKSAQLIEDSDEEYGDIEAFLEKERATREKAAAFAVTGDAKPMRSHGTRKKKAVGKKRKRKDEEDEAEDEVVVVDSGDEDTPVPKTKARPRPVKRAKTHSVRGSSAEREDLIDVSDGEAPASKPRAQPRPVKKSSGRSSSPVLDRSSMPPEDIVDISDDDRELDLEVATTIKKKRLAIVVSDEDE